MDKDISTASKYLNNLLAARGLLKGGHKIAFDNPTEDETTPTRIINLVHDLVRRRDRDGEQKETLAMGMKALKEAEAKASATADRYKSRCEELERRCATLQGQERVLNANVRSAEITAKALKDETSRLKIMVQQVRTQCANDIRKRDHQISKLKERLLEKTRGGRGNKQPMSFPGVTLSGTASTAHLGSSVTGEVTVSMGTDQALIDDTTAFLTTLSQSLADENDTLVSMIKSTVTTLKAISGMDTEVDQEAELEEGDRNVVATDVSHSTLSNQVDEVLEHLKDMLNQPNYVPVEDLDTRDREIERLKTQLQGTLEAWKNAIALVDLVNKKPEATNSKKIKALENAVERERKTVLEELDVNVRTEAAAEESPSNLTPADSENGDVWQKQAGAGKSVEKTGFMVAEDAENDQEIVEYVEEDLEVVEETEGVEQAGTESYEEEAEAEEEFVEEFQEEYQQEEEYEEESVFEEQPIGEPQSLNQDDDSVDLVPPPILEDDDDESSMEIMSPIKPTVYSKKRSLVEPLQSSPLAVKRTRFIDAAPRRRGHR